MAVRCEYCGQLYEGLSCPHCCAPRGESEEDECVEPDYDSMTFRDFSEILDGIKETCDPEWILTNSSCVGNNNVQVIGDNNVVNGELYPGNSPHYVDCDVCLDGQPSERDERIDAICGTCTHDAQASAKVRELANEQAKKHGKDRWLWGIINFACAWLGTFSLGVVIGAPIGFAIGTATIFSAALCWLAADYV